MVQSDKDACYTNYAYHFNHDILDTCLMQTKGLQTTFQRPEVQRLFPRYQYSQLMLADPSHSLAYPAYAVPQAHRKRSLLPQDVLLVDDRDVTRPTRYYYPMHQKAVSEANPGRQSNPGPPRSRGWGIFDAGAKACPAANLWWWLVVGGAAAVFAATVLRR